MNCTPKGVFDSLESSHNPGGMTQTLDVVKNDNDEEDSFIVQKMILDSQLDNTLYAARPIHIWLLTDRRTKKLNSQLVCE